MRKKLVGVLGLLAMGGVACSEQLPTAVGDDLFPDDPVTMEIRLTWDEFASNLEVYSGYGSPLQVGAVFLANGYGEDLVSRSLFRFTPLPTTVTVTDSSGTQRTDDQLTLVGGRIVAFMDTLQSINEGPVTLEIGAVHEKWHAGTVNWDLAVDTVGEQRAWAVGGAGEVTDLATTVWDPAEGDSAVFLLDSAQVEMWNDTAEVNQGVRLSIVNGGVRLKVDHVVLRGTVIPSVRPDTLVDITAARYDFTFIYSPPPEAVAGDIRVGGVPAWRTFFDVDLPATLNGPAALCAAVPCPLTLTPEQVSYAAVVLKGRRGPVAFQPVDSLRLDVRAAYDRSVQSKTPLGSTLVGPLGRPVSPDLFSEDEGGEVEFPITAFVRTLVRGDSIQGFPPPHTLALLSIFEPSSLAFASFFGPGGHWAPELKLIITAGHTVELP